MVPSNSPPPFNGDNSSLPESPPYSPESYSAGEGSRPVSTSSLDYLPHSMNDHGPSPYPSSGQANMVAHSSNVTLEDDDDDDDNDDNDGPLPPHSYRHFSRSEASIRQSPATESTGRIPRSVTAPQSDSGVSSARPLNTGVASSHTFNPDIRHNHPHSPFSFLSGHGSYTGSEHSGNSKTLNIELSDPEVVLMNGNVSVMRGTVYVNLHKNIKVKTLQLEFSGRTAITWMDENTYSASTRHTNAPHIEHSWPLIAHDHKQPSTLLQAGQHAFTFSLELPDTLPETITTVHGKVAYKLTATLTKPGISFHTSTTSVPVIIRRRHPVQASRSYQRGGRASNEADDKIKYKITVPQVRVPHSTKVPLQVSITAPTAQTHVQVLQVGLWERVIYKADGRKKVDMRLVKIQKSEGWGRPPNHEAEAWNWNKVLLFDMPHMGSELNQCNPSVDNGLMKVVHIMRFSILGTDGSNRFRTENEIEIKVLAFEDEYQLEPDEEGNLPDVELPSYLTSFTTPRVSIDSERDMDPEDDDLLRSMLQRIHLPTYAESEDSNSRNNSRDVSRNNSLNSSRNPSRSTSPDRSRSVDESLHSILHHPHYSHLTCHHQPLPHSPLSTSFSPATPTTEYPSPLDGVGTHLLDNNQSMARANDGFELLPALLQPVSDRA
ncbi:hypothetical protein BGZ46_010293 [Entomortierella lignicola]|nr:hypothetical protein BGZ46_010293 [Entomortierella lignicola]